MKQIVSKLPDNFMSLSDVPDKGIIVYLPKNEESTLIAILHKIPIIFKARDVISQKSQRNQIVVNENHSITITQGSEFTYYYGFKYLGQENSKASNYKFLNAKYSECLKSVIEYGNTLLYFESASEFIEFAHKRMKGQV